MEAGHAVRVGAEEPAELGGEGEFGAVEGDEVDGGDGVLAAVGTGNLLPYDPGVARLLVREGEFGEALDDEAGVDLEELDRVGDQTLLGEV